jgi:NADH:ubiquinone reductase (H+-translocating)
MPEDSRAAPHRVVVVGGGFGGVRAARALRKLPVEVTLLDRTNHHLFQPLLYQVATGVLSPGQIAPALRSLFRGDANVRVLLAEVTGFDLERRVVHAIAEHAIAVPYDTLIVAAGSTHSYFGNDEWADVAPGMKSLDDANRLRSRILGAFELAEQAQDPLERAAWLTFVVVGAGPTGVELAGQIAVLARRVLRHEYRAIDPRDARIVLVDGADAVLPAFHEELSDRARRDLGDLGVDVQLSAMAVGVDHDGIDLRCGDTLQRIDAKTIVWAAGVQASPLASALGAASGAEVDRAGRIRVEPDLSVPGHPEVFAIGDMALVPGVPGVAQGAMQEADHVAKVVRARLRGTEPPAPFRYRDKGTMATIGRTRAVAQVARLRLTGFPAFVLWGFVHLAYLVGWGNRLEAVARWMWTLLARNRRERLISVVSLVSPEEGRAEIEALRRRGAERLERRAAEAERPAAGPVRP